MNHTSIKRSRNIDKKPILFLLDKDTDLKELGIEAASQSFIKEKIKQKQNLIHLTQEGRQIFVAHVELGDEAYKTAENFRLAGSKTCHAANASKLSEIAIQNASSVENAHLLAAEGMALSNYQFLKYKHKPEEEANSLKNILLLSSEANKAEVDDLQNVVDGVYHARTLVNEPLNFLTAPQLAKEMQKLGKKAGFKVTVFDKKRIEKENMQGLLAVNLGSIDHPSFTISEWKPKKPKNKQPIVLVGKGVVFDTGGLSLKPTSNSMDFMKCDMSGAATVMGAMYSIAKNKLPLHVIALLPATDNRPGLNAYVPGDIIKMRDGLRVEVLNTDAEGRMIMADALSYAKNYDPELVIDFATLTGSAMRAIGPFASALMSKASREKTQKMLDAGYASFERLVELPLWEEYGELVKSDIGDIKNVGGPTAGAITAGKFLENFTDYPWMHLDIAPTAWNFKNMGYRLKNGTGVGVRLLVEFLKNY